MKPTVLENKYANQRPFKGLSVGTIIGILVIGLVLLSLSAQAKETKNIPASHSSSTADVPVNTYYFEFAS